MNCKHKKIIQKEETKNEKHISYMRMKHLYYSTVKQLHQALGGVFLTVFLF